jgi:hypothetical protein
MRCDRAPTVKRDCTFWGDPHVITFDRARPSFYGDGEYWIVKSDQVKIQGRYMGTAYTFGLAATNKVVVSGPFIQGHKIEVPNLEDGPILIDGKPALTSFGTVQVGGAQITYDGNGELIDEATSVWAKKIVHMYLPGDIQMHVYRWSNYMDLKITMAPLAGGQDGSCGNFNGDPGDDRLLVHHSHVGEPGPCCAFGRHGCEWCAYQKTRDAFGIAGCDYVDEFEIFIWEVYIMKI